jgi:hypothetical protein
MTEPGNSVPTERDDDLPSAGSYGSASSFGDPTLELFGNGWNPNPEPTPTSSDTYTGRHRAPDG